VLGEVNQIWQVANAAPGNGSTNTVLLINANTGSIAMCPTGGKSATLLLKCDAAELTRSVIVSGGNMSEVGGQYAVDSQTLVAIHGPQP